MLLPMNREHESAVCARQKFGGAGRTRPAMILADKSRPEPTRVALAIHTWWSNSASLLLSPDEQSAVAARELAAGVATGTIPAVTLTGWRDRPS